MAVTSTNSTRVAMENSRRRGRSSRRCRSRPCRPPCQETEKDRRALAETEHHQRHHDEGGSEASHYP